jgi:hypothetical protein
MAATLTLPVFDRLAPPHANPALAAAIEAGSGPDDVVVDLAGRGGWVARAALALGRRALSIETSPLTRLLADVVVRPPDLRHLDAAFQGVGSAPLGTSSLRVWIMERFATLCPTCGRTLAAEELIWEPPAGGGDAVPIRRAFRCAACLDRRGRGNELRQAPPEAADLDLAGAFTIDAAVREELRRRFPVRGTGAESLPDELLGLHSERQLGGLHAILARIDGDLRASQVTSALRLAFLHAVFPASRLNAYPGRASSIRIAGGRLRAPGSPAWRERNPWLAFEEGYALVRGFVQALDNGPLAAVQARLVDRLDGLVGGAPMISLRVSAPDALERLAAEGAALAPAERARVRLVLGQSPVEWTPPRLSEAYVLAGWCLGSEAARLLPLDPLFDADAPPPARAALLRAGLEAVAPALAADGRAVVLLEPDGPPGLVGAALAAASAGWRVVDARLAEPGARTGGSIELIAPTGRLGPGSRTRANRSLRPAPGGAGDPASVPGRGIFGAPEAIDGRFSPSEAARAVTETAVAVLQARGEPAERDRLLGPVLVALDRCGQLRRFAMAVGERAPGPRDQAAAVGERAPAGPAAGAAVTPTDAATPTDTTPAGPAAGAAVTPTDATRAVATPTDTTPAGPTAGAKVTPTAATRAVAPPTDATPAGPAAGAAVTPTDAATPTNASAPAVPSSAAVRALLDLVDGELLRPDQRRLAPSDEGRLWLADPHDEAAAAAPLADRLEWAVFSLLGTEAAASEAALREGIRAMFAGSDTPDPWLVDACLKSYAEPGTGRPRLAAVDHLQRRTEEHTATIALLAEVGHRLGLHVSIAPREQGRRSAGRPLATNLAADERGPGLAFLGRAGADAVAQVDCLWYARPRFAFLFEVEWTAMLGEPVLRRGRGIAPDDRIVRFLVTVPERSELLRAKLRHAPVLRRAMDEGNWHILRLDALRRFAALPAPSLEDLQPYLGLDPASDGPGDQMPLFEG